MKVKAHHYNLEMEHPFGISRSVHSFQETFIVELQQDGKRGYGEATQNTYYGFSLQNMQAKLDELQSEIERYPFTTPDDFWDNFLYPKLKNFRFLMAAIDEAANDLYGKLLGKPLWQIWNYNIEHLPQSTYTIGIDTIEVMQQKLIEKPWPIYKIKLGTAHDIEIIKALRKITDSPFRIDANTGWTAEQTIENSKILRDFGVEFIEQPMPYDAYEAMKEVKKHSVLPIIADESIRTENDVQICAESFDGINVKLVKAGGITPARRMLSEARQLGIKTMLGCMTESSVGISAAAQLLPLCDYADLDGAILLKKDIAKGMQLKNGKIIMPADAGTGVHLL
jgi:L-alanine-DL-glutamate epimerase-like enolase superfamily enzyme